MSSGSSVDLSVMSPGLIVGKEGRRFLPSLSHHSAFLMNPACGLS